MKIGPLFTYSLNINFTDQITRDIMSYVISFRKDAKNSRKTLSFPG